MKNVLIIMLALVVLSSAFGVAIKSNGLAYEETLNYFLSETSIFTNQLIDRISGVSSILKSITGSDITDFDQYSSFTVHYWEDNSGVTQYLIVGHKTAFNASETFLYCTYSEDVGSFDFTWSWSKMYRMLNLRTASGSLIVSIGRGREYENYSDAQKLSDFLATVPALATFRETFEDGRGGYRGGR